MHLQLHTGATRAAASPCVLMVGEGRGGGAGVVMSGMATLPRGRDRLADPLSRAE